MSDRLPEDAEEPRLCPNCRATLEPVHPEVPDHVRCPSCRFEYIDEFDEFDVLPPKATSE